MLRRRLQRRWQNGVLTLEAMDWFLTHWTWIDRYNDWHVARYGETFGCDPRYQRLLGRIVGWIDAWRYTLSLRPGLRP